MVQPVGPSLVGLAAGPEGLRPAAEASSALCRLEASATPCHDEGDRVEIYTSAGRRLVGSPDVVVSLAAGGARTLAGIQPGRDQVIARPGPEGVLFKVSHHYSGLAYRVAAEAPAALARGPKPPVWVAELSVR